MLTRFSCCVVLVPFQIIDDNAMMLMIPFFVVFMIDSFGGREAGAALYNAVHSAPRY